MELEGFSWVVCIHCTQAHLVKLAIFKFQVKGCFRLGRAAVSGPGISHAKACSNAETQMGYREMSWYIAVHDGTKWYENGIYGVALHTTIGV